MEFKDYYKIMGVAEKATPAEIKKAYKKLARRYHPDVSKEQNAEQKFKEMGEAYEVLGDEAKRQEYDELRAAMSATGGMNRKGQFTPPPGWEASSRHSAEDDYSGFSDFFSSLFGNDARFSQTRAQGEPLRMRGEDVHYDLAILLEEAFAGTEQLIELRVPEVDPNGMRHFSSRKLKLKVPPGMSDGSVLRMKGQGGPGTGGGSAGDLLVTIRLAGHPLFTVTDKHVSLVLPVAPWEAALGCKITVPTLKGKTRLTVPAQSQTGQKLRLAGQGLPGKPPGDFFVVLKVVMPATMTDKAKELYKALEQEQGFNPRTAWEEN